MFSIAEDPVLKAPGDTSLMLKFIHEMWGLIHSGAPCRIQEASCRLLGGFLRYQIKDENGREI